MYFAYNLINGNKKENVQTYRSSEYTGRYFYKTCEHIVMICIMYIITTHT